MSSTDKFATAPLGKLLRQQAIPAAIGIMVMSVYGIVDTIFVGHYVGPNAIGAITVVFPIVFLIASIGMAIGMGGSSILSRSLGSKNKEKAYFTFGNQIVLTVLFSLCFVSLGYLFKKEIIHFFGGHGDVTTPAIAYFEILLIGIPFLAYSMMANSVLRAEGRPKTAMVIILIPAIVNAILTPIFILVFDMGLAGAAWASTISYMFSFSYTLWHFKGKKSQLEVKPKYFYPQIGIIKEIIALGSVTFVRQGVISILAIVLNNSLFYYGEEEALAVYGIVSKLMMFANFPVLGITQGFIPIAGYNYGARLTPRLKSAILLSIKWGTLVAFIVFILIISFSAQLASLFSSDSSLINATIPAIRITFLATPFLAVSLVLSALYQATGHTLPALLLALSKQGIFLIPLVLLLPLFFGVTGIWLAFPIADVGAALLCFFFYKRKGILYRSKSSTAQHNDKLSVELS